MLVYKYSFRCIQLCSRCAQPHDRGERPARRRRARVAVAGATGYTGQELLRLLARHPAVALTAAMSSGATGARGGCRRWRGSGTARSRRSIARRAGARRRRRVPRAARRGRRRARAGAGRRRRARHRPLGRVPAARRGRARALVSGDAPRCPTASPTASPSCERERRRAARGWSPIPAATRRRRCWRSRRCVDAGLLARRRRHHRRREVGRVGRRQDAVRADALLRGPRQPVGVRRVRPPPRRRDRAGRRAARSRSCRTWCRSTAASSRRSTCACAPGTTEEALGDVLRARLRAARRSCGWSARRCRRSSTSRTPTSATSAGASMPSGRVDPRVGHRQPAEGRVGPGRAEHERDARPRRDDGAAVTCEPLVLKFGGELLEEPSRMAGVVGAVADIVAGSAAAARPLVIVHGGGKEIDAALKAAGHREAAGRRPAHHRRARRSTSSSRCWPARSTRGSSRR